MSTRDPYKGSGANRCPDVTDENGEEAVAAASTVSALSSLPAGDGDLREELTQHHDDAAGVVSEKSRSLPEPLVPKSVLSVEALETSLLLEGIYRRYGYDFRDYAENSVVRRIKKRMAAAGLATISALQEQVLHNPRQFDLLLMELSVSVSDFFRQPEFFESIRRCVIPLLKTYPFVRIWHAGCSTGEEVYSLAILLHEEGIYERCRIYATDMNPRALDIARQGIFKLEKMKRYTRSYIEAGGKASFSDYYTARYDNAVFKNFLKNNVVFASHNLVTDGSFNEFNIILCRNVMIYFTRKLQGRVHDLLYGSLAPWGFLGLGDKETLKFTPHEDCYEEFDENRYLFRKTR